MVVIAALGLGYERLDFIFRQVGLPCGALAMSEDGKSVAVSSRKANLYFRIAAAGGRNAQTDIATLA